MCSILSIIITVYIMFSGQFWGAILFFFVGGFVALIADAIIGDLFNN